MPSKCLASQFAGSVSSTCRDTASALARSPANRYRTPCTNCFECIFLLTALLISRFVRSDPQRSTLRATNVVRSGATTFAAPGLLVKDVETAAQTVDTTRYFAQLFIAQQGGSTLARRRLRSCFFFCFCVLHMSLLHFVTCLRSNTVALRNCLAKSKAGGHCSKVVAGRVWVDSPKYRCCNGKGFSCSIADEESPRDFVRFAPFGC